MRYLVQEDKMLPVEMAGKFQRAFQSATMKIIPNCGHNPQEEYPEEVNGLIRWFAGEVVEYQWSQ